MHAACLPRACCVLENSRNVKYVLIARIKSADDDDDDDDDDGGKYNNCLKIN